MWARAGARRPPRIAGGEAVDAQADLHRLGRPVLEDELPQRQLPAEQPPCVPSCLARPPRSRAGGRTPERRLGTRAGIGPARALKADNAELFFCEQAAQETATAVRAAERTPMGRGHARPAVDLRGHRRPAQPRGTTAAPDVPLLDLAVFRRRRRHPTSRRRIACARWAGAGMTSVHGGVPAPLANLAAPFRRAPRTIGPRPPPMQRVPT